MHRIQNIIISFPLLELPYTKESLANALMICNTELGM